MVEQKDANVIDKTKVPAGRAIGAYTFLRDMGKKLTKSQAIEVSVKDTPEASKVQNRWRSYFKKDAHSRRETQANGKITVYLWLG